jgi:peptidoglycan/xylan/chitin deacetylase (PgdA/CDA1 family)
MATNGRSAKRFVEAVLARSWQPKRQRRVVVLCYHSIHPSLPFASASPELFRQHLQWLNAHCDVVPLRSLPIRTGPARGARPIVAITFDDGYEDNYTYAFPLLKEARVPATVFLTTGLIAADPGVIQTFCDLYDVAPELVAGLSWPQIREMRQDGVEFGAHTHTHPNLSFVGAARAATEIRTSKDILEEHLQESVVTFAYPFGRLGIHFDARTVDVIAELGFERAVAVRYRGVRPTDSPLRIPRFAVTNDSVDILAAKVYGKLDVLGLWQEWAPLPVARLTAEDRSRLPEVRRRTLLQGATGPLE